MQQRAGGATFGEGAANLVLRRAERPGEQRVDEGRPEAHAEVRIRDHAGDDGGRRALERAVDQAAKAQLPVVVFYLAFRPLHGTHIIKNSFSSISNSGPSSMAI